MRLRYRFSVIAIGLLLINLSGCEVLLNVFSSPPSPPGLAASELAIIVNQADPLSQEIGTYYQQRRGIPTENLISVTFPPNRTTLSPAEFAQIKRQIDGKTPHRVQAFALTWAAPYRVGCMSITSAFAFGFSDRYCANTCKATAANPYFNQPSHKPYDDFQMRPTMAIAARNINQAKELIDRGIRADGTRPTGTAYLLSTSDQPRNVRAALYDETVRLLNPQLQIQVIQANALERKSDVLFYFTGRMEVEKISSNRFLPGAIADHLTSFGGMLTDSSQMSALRWLEAGATGSYGTVVEPCNFPQKFPHPGVVMSHYLAGNTLIEAYWKSVAWTGQGIFVGEPLARPY